MNLIVIKLPNTFGDFNIQDNYPAALKNFTFHNQMILEKKSWSDGQRNSSSNP